MRNPRALKNLMVINKGGCGKYSPGIGDVKFVKDLITDKIVTTNFRCSKFGVAHSKKAQFGWVGGFSRIFLCIYLPTHCTSILGSPILFK